MNTKLKMLSELSIGDFFRTNTGESVYQLQAVLRKGPESLIGGYVVVNSSVNATGLRPFIIDADRPVIVDGYSPVDL